MDQDTYTYETASYSYEEQLLLNEAIASAEEILELNGYPHSSRYHEHVSFEVDFGDITIGLQSTQGFMDQSLIVQAAYANPNGDAVTENYVFTGPRRPVRKYIGDPNVPADQKGPLLDDMPAQEVVQLSSLVKYLKAAPGVRQWHVEHTPTTPEVASEERCVELMNYLLKDKEWNGVHMGAECVDATFRLTPDVCFTVEGIEAGYYSSRSLVITTEEFDRDPERPSWTKETVTFGTGGDAEGRVSIQTNSRARQSGDRPMVTADIEKVQSILEYLVQTMDAQRSSNKVTSAQRLGARGLINFVEVAS